MKKYLLSALNLYRSVTKDHAPKPGRLLFWLAAAATLVLPSACEKNSVAPLSPAGNQVMTSAASSARIGINVLLNTPLTPEILADLETYGQVIDQLPGINALTLSAPRENLARIQKLTYVRAANPDATREAIPLQVVAVSDFSGGINTWDLDAVNVTDLNRGRTIAADATGVYLAVLDTGLLNSWRYYFPTERIAQQYARSFGGGGGEVGAIPEEPNKWEHDQNAHGTHVTSTILGFNFNGTYVNGVAPKATVIPVKVLNQAGWGWSSVISRGIMYVAELKAGPLKNHPVIINMSLSGGVLDAVEKAAIDFAIQQGVIIVAAAGNQGLAGMGYPGAYPPVISAASAGFKGQFSVPFWWRVLDVPDPTRAADFFISDFSSRPKAGQDLDVAAPGENVVGPYQLNSGQTAYFYLSGTSMASPHVAGIVALMAQKKPALQAGEAEGILEATAIRMKAGSQQVRQPDGTTTTISWEANAFGRGLATADAALKGTN